jgi:translation initiation factor 1
MAKRKRIELESEEIVNNPFRTLAQHGEGSDPSGITIIENREEAANVSAKGKSRIERVILRKERKGHGGKTVTIIEIRPPERTDLKEMAKTLKNGLGCGGKVEADLIVLQGDIVKRVSDLFRKMGIRQITF